MPNWFCPKHSILIQIKEVRVVLTKNPLPSVSWASHWPLLPLLQASQLDSSSNSFSEKKAKIGSKGSRWRKEKHVFDTRLEIKLILVFALNQFSLWLELKNLFAFRSKTKTNYFLWRVLLKNSLLTEVSRVQEFFWCGY